MQRAWVLATVLSKDDVYLGYRASVEDPLLIDVIEKHIALVVERKIAQQQKQIADLKKDIELTRKEGECDLLEQQVGFLKSMMGVFGQGKTLAKQGASLLFLPFDQYPAMLGYAPAMPVPPAPAVTPVMAAGIVDAPQSPTNSVLAPANVAPKAVPTGVARHALKYVSRLPVGKMVYVFIRERMSRMSAGSAAILFLLLIVGAYYYAEWRKSGLDVTVASLTTQRDELKTENDGLRAKADKVQGLENELEQVRNQFTAAQLTINEYKGRLEEAGRRFTEQTKTMQTQLATATEKHQAEKQAMQANLDASTKAQLEEMKRTVSDFGAKEKEIADLKLQLQKATDANATLRRDLGTHENTLAVVNKSNAQLQADLSIARAAEGDAKWQKQVLQTYTMGLIGILENTVLRAKSQSLDSAREKFYDMNLVAYKTGETELQKLGIPRLYKNAW